jgi:flavin reductase (DIM6/NTAB) family NADH-FMN oxidoreductase RutF
VSEASRLIRTAELGGRDRYQLLTSLVAPRPIAWVSTYGPDGVANLAPFSYFAALSATPMLIGVSIGERGGHPKDTLVNLRASGAFCVNVVAEGQLEAMNLSSLEAPPELDEFALAGLALAGAESVDAPCVRDCPAVLECTVSQEVELTGSANTLVLGEVRAVRLGSSLSLVEGSWFVDHRSLRPVGRLWGAVYALLGETPHLPRPVPPERPEG